MARFTSNERFAQWLESEAEAPTWILQSVRRPRVRMVFGNKAKVHIGLTGYRAVAEAQAAYRAEIKWNDRRFDSSRILPFKTGKAAADWARRNPAK